MTSACVALTDVGHLAVPKPFLEEGHCREGELDILWSQQGNTEKGPSVHSWSLA